MHVLNQDGIRLHRDDRQLPTMSRPEQCAGSTSAQTAKLPK